MDMFKTIKIWQTIGKVLNTKIGSSISHAVGQSVNFLASKAVSTNNDDIPWAQFKKPLTGTCLALVSTAGFYREGDEPFDMDSMRGDAGLRIIPSKIDKEKLKIAHTHYSHARVKKDINVLFPTDRLAELVDANVIGRLATNFYSFGFGGDLVQEFIGKPDGSAHKLVQKLKADKVDCVLMVPA